MNLNQNLIIVSVLVNVPLEEITREEKLFSAFKYVKSIADHYNIYKDLFKHAYFVPTLDLQVSYGADTNVFHGNKLQTKLVTFSSALKKKKKLKSFCLIYLKTSNRPEVKWGDLTEGKGGQIQPYHSLLFLNLDGNFNNSDNQVLLWFM